MGNRSYKLRTISMDDVHHRKARIIAANLDKEGLSDLFRWFVDKEWGEHYEEYKNFTFEGSEAKTA